MSVEAPVSNSPGLLADYLSSVRPLVSVICISYNHGCFIKAALQSVLEQTYPAIELIVIDNDSKDDTRSVIQEVIDKNPSIQFIANADNVGLCRAFNQGLKQAKGKYVIDLSADDLLHPNRVETQVKTFERLPCDYAVVFGNAAFIDETDNVTGYHFPVNQQKNTTVKVPSGWVFKEILSSYFVCTPTMMMRKDVLDSLGGYDESLAYEDFDFWVRSSRDYRYQYIDSVLTSKRVLQKSLSTQFSRPKNRLLQSTLAVCYKAFDQCRTADEYKALVARLRWCIRQCFYAQHFELAFQFKALLEFIEEPDWQTKLFLQFCRLRIPVNKLYQPYLQWRISREKRPVFQ
ncbi:glycosyltransferase [Tellurirhabdus bombi]|uniref:glycosyltransferase n=1 Tax=Tellurirhabdus bombi TaxID=2907205 RepID=UPI001F29DB5E|nr:glycosyltransferase [Tellurirhabdus bombi]